MDKVLYIVGGLTALLAALVLGDSVRNLRVNDEMPIITAWVGGWILIGMGALVRATKNKA